MYVIQHNMKSFGWFWLTPFTYFSNKDIQCNFLKLYLEVKQRIWTLFSTSAESISGFAPRFS